MHMPIARFLWALLLTFAVLPAAAQDMLRIGELSKLDLQYMLQQRQYLTELTERHYGRGFNRSKQNDLGLLQRLLDDGLVTANQTQALQAMGVVMGDLLAAEFGLRWVIYEDQLGRSRALRYRETDNYLFPITMISRRREVDNRTPVSAIYDKAAAEISAAIPPLPFQ